MTIYLSGPMTGYPRYNEDMFAIVAYILKMRGFEFVNPNALPTPEGLADEPQEDWWLYIRRCLNYLHENPVDMILLLPGCEDSFGSRMEKLFAEKMNIPVRYFSDFMLNEFLDGAPKEADHDEAK